MRRAKKSKINDLEDLASQLDEEEKQLQSAMPQSPSDCVDEDVEFLTRVNICPVSKTLVRNCQYHYDSQTGKLASSTPNLGTRKRQRGKRALHQPDVVVCMPGKFKDHISSALP